jgi:hypothetical protein
MEESDQLNEEINDGQLTEVISQFQQFALGAGAVVCQACGTPLREDRRVTAYAFRACRHTG